MAEFERQFNVDVTWWPYELHPETPPEGRSVDELFGDSPQRQQYREHLKAYGREAGITFASNRWLSNSRDALALAEFARDSGAFDCVHWGLFRAYFEEAKDIGKLDVLKEIAANCGLNPLEFEAELTRGRYAELVQAATASAQRSGIRSTPTMIFGDKFAVSGAQELLVYQDVLRRLGAEERAAPAAE